MLAKNAPETAPINRSISRLTQRDNLVMLKLFRTAYCVIKHNFSLRSFPVLITLQECNGLPLGHAYRNSVAACTFLHSISYVLQNGIVNDLKSADYFSLLLDGSTNVTVHEQEIMYARILKDGKPHNIFLGLMSLPSGSAEGISSGLHSFFSDMGFLNWKEKLVSLGTDGASVNVGAQGGLGAVLKKDIPYLLQVHCVAHRLELAVLDACKNVDYIETFQVTVKTLLKFYCRSGKRLNQLSSIGDGVLNETVKSFGSWNPVRWIASKYRVIKAINNNWAATVLHLEQIVTSGKRDEAAVAQGILKKICSVKFTYFLGFMCDFTSILAKLSEAFQANNLSLSSAIDELDATLGVLKQLEVSPGYSLLSFREEYDDINNPTKFRNIDIKGGKRDIDFISRVIARLTSGAVTYLERRFELDGVFRDLEIFDPSNWPTTTNDKEAVISYGNDELIRVMSHFNKLLPSDIEDKAQNEWVKLKLFACKRIPLKERYFHILWPRIATDHRFVSIFKIVSLVILLPMNTACCERGFSAMNRIKSKGRARLKNSTLNSMMLICTDGPSLESFDPQSAVDHWSKVCHRRPGSRHTQTHIDSISDSSASDSDESSIIELSESENEMSDC